MKQRKFERIVDGLMTAAAMTAAVGILAAAVRAFFIFYG